MVQLLLVGAVNVYDVNVIAVMRARERDLLAVGRPRGSITLPVLRQPLLVAAVRIHRPNVVSLAVAFGIRDLGSVRGPRGTEAASEIGHVGAVRAHREDLRVEPGNGTVEHDGV